LYEETDKNTKKLNNYCHFPVWNLNWVPPE
jgi:hypothetical protein